MSENPKMTDSKNFNFRNKAAIREAFVILGILICSAVSLAFSLLPATPIYSHEAGKAYSQYLKAPSEETKRVYEGTVARVNSPFHLLQYSAAISGLTLPLVFVLRRRKSHRIQSRLILPAARD
jgi:hypothetical protein